MPISAYDIDPSGAATVAGDGPAQRGYRWVQYSLDDPELPSLAMTLPDIPAASLTAPETRPRCEPYGDGVIVNLRGINLNDDGPADQMVAVRLWVTKDLVVTVQARRVRALDALGQETAEGAAPATPMAFVAQLARKLMRRVRDEVFELSDRVDGMEDSVVDDGAPLPQALAEERRMAIRLRRYLGPQRDALDALVALDSPLMTEVLRAQLREQANLANLTVEELDALVARMTAVQDHHTAQAALKQGHNGYVLSIIAAVFLPLGFVTGLFGVNVAGMPGVETPWAFAALCAAMIVISVAALWGMRRLKWI